MQETNIKRIASELIRAQDDCIQLSPITARYSSFNITDAYKVAKLIHEQRLEEGWVPVGRKIGFTNTNMWPIYGVCEPVWAFMYDRTVTQLTEAQAECLIGEYHEAGPALSARLLAERLLLESIRTWAKNTGFVSYDKVQIRSESDKQPNFLQFSWDLSAPSYVGGLVSLSADNNVKPGFFVADVKLDSSISLQDIQPFIYKCVTTRSLKGSPRCLQFLVCERFDKDAFVEAKKNGILPVTPESLFGKDVAKSIRLLISVLTEIGTQVMDLDKLNSIFEGLSKFEGAIANLRGALFEYMVANILQETVRPHRIEMNYVTRTVNGQKAESDIALVYGNVGRFIECKGYSPYSQVPDKEVLKWLQDRVPKVRAFCLEQHDWKDKDLEFEFWTTGKLSTEAKAKLDAAIEGTKKYKLRVFEATDVRDQATAAGKEVLALFKQHFFDDSSQKSVAKDLSKATSLATPSLHNVDNLGVFLD